LSFSLLLLLRIEVQFDLLKQYRFPGKITAGGVFKILQPCSIRSEENECVAEQARRGAARFKNLFAAASPALPGSLL
jgi:hypothetical protein